MLFIKRLVDFSVWLIIIASFLLGFLVLMCNNANPGDSFYPVKQSLGNYILNFSKGS